VQRTGCRKPKARKRLRAFGIMIHPAIPLSPVPSRRDNVMWMTTSIHPEKHLALFLLADYKVWFLLIISKQWKK
jgi:hypothetical protein